MNSPVSALDVKTIRPELSVTCGSSDTSASDKERGRSRRATKFIVFRVTYDDGHEKTLEVQTPNRTTGYHRALYLARRGQQIARIEFVEVIER
jgi:hypothetical protein